MKKITLLVLLIILLNTIGCYSPSISIKDNKEYKQLYEKSIQDQPPLIKDIQFDGKTVNNNGWCEVGEKVKIDITLEGNCSEVDLFYTPAGSAVYKEQKLIEKLDVESGQNTVEYIWDVPEDTMGFFNIIAFNKNLGRRSDLFNVISAELH